jgi:Uma2 family endonuclease
MATVITPKRPRNGHLPPLVAPADGICLHLPRSELTLDWFREWVTSDDFPEKVRVTYVDQEIYLDMSKEELETHAAVKAEISWVLMGLYRHSRRGKFHLDGVLVTNVKANVSNNPDAVFVSRKSIELGLVRLVPEKGKHEGYVEIEGTPDWVLEIVSASSVRKDLRQLRRAYHRAGIKEYWLVDARGETIDFQILHWRKNGYAAAPNKGGWQRSHVFDREFRPCRERDDLGLWEYTLDMRTV